MTEWTVPATVTRVVDADTLVAVADLGWHISLTSYVRLYGVNAPEQNTEEGQAATDYVTGLIQPGDKITLVSHRLLGQTDNYGRVLASVLLRDGRDLSHLLLETGNAEPYGSAA